MWRVGRYGVPFPYAPYALQEHAVTSLREWLDDDDNNNDNNNSDNNNDNDTRVRAAPPRIAVLESPTGTGKSQMLLNGVLSHVYELASDASDDDKNDDNDDDDDNTQQDKQNDDTGVTAPPPPLHATAASPTLTFEQALRQQRVDDATQAARQRLRRARKRQRRQRQAHAHQQQRRVSCSTASSPDNNDDDDDLLIAQDDDDDDDAYAALHSDSSSDSDSEADEQRSNVVDDDDDKNDNDDNDDESRVEAALATHVPLRQPKVYFASRTHTQLQQLFDDWQRTAWAQQRVRARRVRNSSSNSSSSDNSSSKTTATRRLRAVHVAGRQQLCIHAGIRQRAAAASDGVANSSDTSQLNELCVEAMRYEYSAAGRAARRAAARQHARGVYTAALHGIATTASPHDALPRIDDDDDDDALADVEDAHLPLHNNNNNSARDTTSPGCAFCVEAQLRKLLRHVVRRRRTTGVDSTTTTAREGVCCSVSLREMLQLGRELGACPYLATRLLVRGADVVFIPYSYLVDEEQRYTLLGGAATNAITEAEVRDGDDDDDDVDEQYTHNDSGDPSAGGDDDTIAHVVTTTTTMARTSSARHGAPALSLTAMLRQQQQQQQRHAAYTHTRASSRLPDKKHYNNSNSDHNTTRPRVRGGRVACTLPPRLTRALVVIDEAHNLADYCRAVSHAAVCATQLRVVLLLVRGYAARYEARLLSATKQRLRELCMLLDKLSRYMTTGSSSSSSAPPLPQTTTTTPQQVLPFHAWLFDADVAYVDVFVLLRFLATTRLCQKLRGLVQSTYTASTTTTTTTTTTTRAETSCSTWRDLPAQLSAVLSPCATDTVTRNSNDNGSSSSHALRASQQRVLAYTTRALQHVVHFLRWLYYSDATTRVVCEHDNDNSNNEATLRLVQLEPGRHTVYELLCRARATVLAGGTMQPLALTCAPLLLHDSSNSYNNDNDNDNNTMRAVLQHVRLIVEGHVVPPSSIAVWALPSGPGGTPMHFSYKTMTAATTTRTDDVENVAVVSSGNTKTTAAASSSSSSSTATAVLSELALTLLNVARVVPPAGVVVFFSSHDMVARTLAHLRATGYYDAIDAVKRIFYEGATDTNNDDDNNKSSRRHTATASVRASAADVQRTLDAYRAWLHGNASTTTTTTLSSPSSSPSCARGAMLFAVMGGRLAEGVNFVDDMARMVVVVGVPFANPHDVELQLHLRHTAQHMSDTRTRTRTTTTSTTTTTITARDAVVWQLYTDLCMRTVNQCIGRCIRHAGDYAVVLLVDARYATRAELRGRVSHWLQPSLRVARNFGECFRGVRDFFASR